MTPLENAARAKYVVTVCSDAEGEHLITTLPWLTEQEVRFLDNLGSLLHKSAYGRFCNPDHECAIPPLSVRPVNE